MASRYWVGGAGTWDASDTTHWSASSGGAGGASVPTSVDDVIFDTASNASAYAVAISATVNCLNITIANPAAGALTLSGSGAMNVYGNFTVTSTFTRTWTGDITFRSTTTGKTITSNGVQFNNHMIFDGVGGGWTLQDNFNNGTSGRLFTLTNGSLDTNGKTVTTSNFNSSNTNTRSLTLGASVINLQSTSPAWNFATTSGLTFNAGTSTINITNGGIDFYGGGLTYYNVSIGTLNAFSACEIRGANTFNNFTITHNSNIVTNYVLTDDQTVNGVLTLTGNSTINRLMLRSSVLGTARTITAASVTASYVDLQDITGAGAASWNLSAITGNSGDCGGNSGITFTTPADQHWTNTSGGNWGLSSNWTSRIPLPQDNVFMDCAFTTNRTVTVNMARMGKSIDWTSATWVTSLTWTFSNDCFLYGSLTLISGLTSSGSGSAFTFAGRSNCTFNAHGVTMPHSMGIAVVGATLSLQSDINLTRPGLTVLSAGTFDANNFNVTFQGLSAGGGITRGVTMGSGTWTLIGVGSIWNMVSAVTVNAGTSTIKITHTNNSDAFFTGGGKTYYNLWIARGATSTATNRISGSNTFNDITDDGTAAHALHFEAGSLTTVNTFNVVGASGAVITINTALSTSTHSLHCAAGSNISCDWLNIQHSVVTPSATWYAGANSTNNQGVATAGSGWIFSAPPVEIDLDFTTDALLQAASELVHTTDGQLGGDRELAHTTDAFMVDGDCLVYDTDLTYDNAFIYDCPVDNLVFVSHSTDASLWAVLEKTHSTDALFQDTFTKVHTTDALLYDQNELGHTTDALLRDTAFRNHATDALLQAVFDREHTTDALLKDEKTRSHLTDALLQAQNERSHVTDALLWASFTVLHSTDALLFVSNLLSHSTDAYLALPPQYGTLLAERGVVAENAIEVRLVEGVSIIDNRNVSASNAISPRNVAAQNSVSSRGVIAKNSLTARSVSTS